VRVGHIQDILTRHFDKLFNTPEVIAEEYSIPMKPVRSAADACVMESTPGRIDTIDRREIHEIPVIPINISTTHTIATQIRMRTGHIEPEEVRSSIKDLHCDSNVNVENRLVETETTVEKTGLIGKKEPKRMELPDDDIHPIELKAEEPDIASHTRELHARQEVFSLGDVRWMYKHSYAVKPTKPRSLDRTDVLYFWKALLREVPTHMGADLELIAIFQGVEVDRFKSIQYDRRKEVLMLDPYPTTYQSRVAGKRCDIIYGRYIPKDRILKTVLESD